MRGLDLELLLFVTSAGLLAANNTSWGKVKGRASRLRILLSWPSFYRGGGQLEPTHIDLTKGGHWTGGCSHFLLPLHIFMLRLSSAGCEGNVWLFAPQLLFSLLSRCCTALCPL